MSKVSESLCAGTGNETGDRFRFGGVQAPLDKVDIGIFDAVRKCLVHLALPQLEIIRQRAEKDVACRSWLESLQSRTGRAPCEDRTPCPIHHGRGTGPRVRDRRKDNHILALPPVGRGRDLVAGCQLQGVDNPQQLGEIAPGRHRVGQLQPDPFVRINHEHRTHGLIVRRVRPSLLSPAAVGSMS